MLPQDQVRYKSQILKIRYSENVSLHSVDAVTDLPFTYSADFNRVKMNYRNKKPIFLM